MLRRLAWSSVPSPGFSAARLDRIIALSRRNNERNHISGMLLFTGAQFLGILEGDDRDLSKLWQGLEGDTRHSALVRIEEERCGQRWFPSWLMARMDHGHVRARLDRLSELMAPAPKWSEMIRPIMMTADRM